MRVHDVVVVGAGLADGYHLDHGFQVLLTSYPEARRVLDFEQLDLRRFEAGAMVRTGDRFHRVADPFRRPGDLFSSLRAPVGTLADKTRVLQFRRRVIAGEVDEIFTRADVPAAERLREAGFSQHMIESFFGPLLTAVSQDPTMSFSSRFLEFVFRMLATGEAAVPAEGIGVVADALVADLPPDTICFGQRVESLDADHVIVDGEKIRSRAVVLATDLTAASQLTGEIHDRGSVGKTTWWYSVEEPPVRRPVIVLGGASSPVGTLAVMSRVSDRYAPDGHNLVAVSCADPTTPEPTVRSELTRWFGSGVEAWETLRVDRIRSALPRQSVGLDPDQPVRLESGLFVAGDHRQNATIDGALVSGRRAGDAVAARLCRDA